MDVRAQERGHGEARLRASLVRRRRESGRAARCSCASVPRGSRAAVLALVGGVLALDRLGERHGCLRTSRRTRRRRPAASDPVIARLSAATARSKRSPQIVGPTTAGARSQLVRRLRRSRPRVPGATCSPAAWACSQADLLARGRLRERRSRAREPGIRRRELVRAHRAGPPSPAWRTARMIWSRSRSRSRSSLAHRRSPSRARSGLG